MKTIHGMLAIEGNTLSENMIWENQSAYYKAIQDSTDANDSGIFVDFMLGIILDAIKQNPHLTMGELSEIVGIAKKNIFNNMKKLQEAGLLVRPGADKNGWWEVIES